MRLVGLLLGAIALPYLAICVFLYLWQTRLIFLPSAALTATPAAVGLAYQDVWVPIAGNVSGGDRESTPSSPSPAQTPDQLHGWWIPAAQPAAPVVLYFHGNGHNISAHVAHAARFHRLGFSVLLMDYRGYGRSQGGFPHEAQVYEDANRMWRFLTEERGIAPEQIILYGHSLGGAIAIELALCQPDAAALIVDGSFTSMQAVVNCTGRYHVLPIRWLLTQRFASIEKVPALQVPVLFIHGTADTTVPADMSEQLYRAAPEPKRLYLVPNADHNGVAEVAGEDYSIVIKQFIEELTNWPSRGMMIDA